MSAENGVLSYETQLQYLVTDWESKLAVLKEEFAKICNPTTIIDVRWFTRGDDPVSNAVYDDLAKFFKKCAGDLIDDQNNSLFFISEGNPTSSCENYLLSLLLGNRESVDTNTNKDRPIELINSITQKIIDEIGGYIGYIKKAGDNIKTATQEKNVILSPEKGYTPFRGGRHKPLTKLLNKPISEFIILLHL